MNEKSDNVGAVEDQDANELRRYPVQGHLYMFEYKAKMSYLKYYDKFPLVYVIKASKKGEMKYRWDQRTSGQSIRSESFQESISAGLQTASKR